MVVRCQPSTEYDRNYQWGANRRPRYDKDSRFAGKDSTRFHASEEPAFQHKRRLGPTGDSVKLGAKGEDEFMLLGKNNEKFAPSVPYRHPDRNLRPRTAPGRQESDAEVSTPETPRLEKPVRNQEQFRRRRSRSPREGKPYKRVPERRPRHRPLVETAIQTEEDLEAAIKRIAERGGGRPATAGKMKFAEDVRGGERIAERKPIIRNGYYAAEVNGRAPGRQDRRYDGRYPSHEERHRRAEDVVSGKVNRDDLKLSLKDKPRDKYRGEEKRDGEKVYADNRYYDGDYRDRNGRSPDMYYGEARGDGNYYKQWERPVTRKRLDGQEYQGRGRENGFSDEPKVSRKKTKKGKPPVERLRLDEKVHKKQRTNERAGQMRSREISPDDYYAKKYELGISEERAKPLARLSEYQREYDWKKGLKHSKFLANEDVFHRSHLNPPRFKGLRTQSEYQRQYKPFRLRRTQDDGDIRPPRIEPPRRAMTPPPRISMHGREYASHETINPQRLSFPHGRHHRKGQVSEYSANYRDFWHDRSLATAPPAPAEREGLPWFKEIVEMRRMAEEYRRRARGTHFSREHMAQLLSNKAALWDPPSSAEERAAKARRRGRGGWRQKRSASYSPPRVRQSRELQKGARDPRDRSRTSSGSPPRIPTDKEGRLPTPRAHPYTRHHLDRTTPAIGGTLLTAPNETPRFTSESETASFEPPPAAGKPSLDTHLILDEDASHDTPVRTPPRQQRQTRANNPYQDEDLASELSFRSMASSSSLASETLDRARKRRDEFWGSG